MLATWRVRRPQVYRSRGGNARSVPKAAGCVGCNVHLCIWRRQQHFFEPEKNEPEFQIQQHPLRLFLGRAPAHAAAGAEASAMSLVEKAFKTVLTGGQQVAIEGLFLPKGPGCFEVRGGTMFRDVHSRHVYFVDSNACKLELDSRSRLGHAPRTMSIGQGVARVR